MLKSILLFVFCLMITSVIGQRVCPRGYIHFKETFSCHKLIRSPGSWKEAREACAEEGAHLLSVHSSKEMKLVRALMWTFRVRNVFLGLYKLNATTNFTNVDGTDVDYFNWMNGITPRRRGKICVSVSRDRNFKWIVFPCNNRIPFMCKFYPDRSLLAPKRQRCYTCEHAATNEECNANGKQDCPFGATHCQNEIRLSGNTKWISKRCKEKNACEANFLQNGRASWLPSQCAPSLRTNSVCRCCCTGDLCNDKELPCLNETACTHPAPTPRNAIVVCTRGQQPGSICTTRCRVGYRLEGNATRQCISSSGTWSKGTQACKLLKCNSRQRSPVNGSVRCSNNNYYRSRCQFSCRKNYGLQGRKTLTCGLSKRWSAPSPTCREITCPRNIVAPSNGSMTTPSSFAISSRITFGCDVGFRMNGKPTLICVDRNGDGRGEWSSPKPSCDIIRCPSLIPPEKSEFMDPPARMVYGSMINMRCFSGYFQVGDSNLLCSDPDNDGIGEWNGTLATCNLITCPILEEPTNSKLMMPQLPVLADVISVTCDEGYHLVGRSNIQCFDFDDDGAGEWNGNLPTCRQITCSPLVSPENGNFYNSLIEPVYGSVFTVECSEGYFLVGNNAIECVDSNKDGVGEWNGALPTCRIITCPVLDPPERGEFTDPPTEFRYGSVLTSKCFTGYFLIGLSSIRCYDPNNDGIGEWNGDLPICRSITCIPLDPPENGQLTNTEQITYGSVVTVDCLEGYFLVGRNNLQCFDKNNDGLGEWNGELPTCRQITCQPPSAPENGIILFDTIDHIYGSLVRFECDIKYFLIGSETLRCGDVDGDGEGAWIENPPTCSLITCPTLTAPQNGLFISFDSNEFGSVLKVGCDAGYLLNGESSLSCVDVNNDGIGAWNASLPTCQRIMCLETLEAPENGDVSTPSPPEWGSRASYTCDSGYYRNGLGERRCGDQEGIGEWMDQPPTCILIECNELENPDNGDYTATSSIMSVGTGLGINCHEAYHEQINGDVVCSDTGNSSVGKWVGNLPTCVLIECNELPDPANGEYTETSLVLRVGTRLGIRCNEGYHEQLEGDVLCSDAGDTSIGEWTGSLPSCVQIECDVFPTPENGDVTCAESNLYGSLCTFSCGYGYWLDGNASTECIDTDEDGIGEWVNPSPTCERVACSELAEPTNGNISCNDSIHMDSECHFSCQAGYFLSGNDIVTCQERNNVGVGEWSGEPAVCKQISCEPQASPENGDISCTDGQIYGSRCFFECTDGFSLVGADFALCTDPASDGTGRWQGIQEFPPICESVLCEPPSFDPVNGSHACSDGDRFRSECSYTCAEGYKLVGSSNRDCRADRSWSDEQPTCEILRCQPGPRNPQNGLVFCSDGDKYGSKCQYFCDLGYEMVGSSTSFCSVDSDGDGFGEFSEDPPLCEAIFCPVIEGPVPGGRVICGLGLPSADSNRYASECVLACDDGWIIDGTHRVACFGKGSWSDTLGSCERYSCVPPLQTPALGSKRCSSRDDAIGTECTFSCDKGTSISGNSLVTCSRDGTWSSGPPICIR